MVLLLFSAIIDAFLKYLLLFSWTFGVRSRIICRLHSVFYLNFYFGCHVFNFQELYVFWFLPFYSSLNLFCDYSTSLNSQAVLVVEIVKASTVSYNILLIPLRARLCPSLGLMTLMCLEFHLFTFINECQDGSMLLAWVLVLAVVFLTVDFS